MGAVSPRPTAASRRSVRLTVLALLACAIWLSTTYKPAINVISGAEGLARQQVAAATAAAAAADSSMSAARPVARPLYGLQQPDLEAAVVAASERHGAVTKVGPVPRQFWTDQRRSWRERVFLEMLKRDTVQPRSSEYWAADPATGELALRPLALPYPLCHTYVNHKYKVIFIIHPKSASTAIKRYMQLCRIQQTDSCLSPLDDGAQLAPLAEKWQEYFVFTFVRNPWVRAFSSWKFLRQGYMLPAGTVQMSMDDAPLASGKDLSHFAPDDQEPCAEAGWADYCGDPLLLGRLCLVQPHCCPGREGQHFMHYHMTDQATCLLTEDGQLAVDFIGRVENVDEDMRAAVETINSRLPPGVEPLQLGDEVAARNVGPSGEAAGPPENARYVSAFQGAANSTCFRKLARFYAKDIKLMFPSLYASWGGDETSPAAAATAGRIKMAGQQAWRRSRLRLN